MLQVLTDKAPSRQSLGFSEDDIILASFNQLYKIEPAVFGAWMQILKKVLLRIRVYVSEDGIVLTSFNQCRIEPAVFGAWMQILKRVTLCIRVCGIVLASFSQLYQVLKTVVLCRRV